MGHSVILQSEVLDLVDFISTSNSEGAHASVRFSTVVNCKSTCTHLDRGKVAGTPQTGIWYTRLRPLEAPKALSCLGSNGII